jgi:hypothetical protein
MELREEQAPVPPKNANNKRMNYPELLTLDKGFCKVYPLAEYYRVSAAARHITTRYGKYFAVRQFPESDECKVWAVEKPTP